MAMTDGAAIVDLTEQTHVHTVWFVDGQGCGFDVMGALFREGDGEWQARYRFRYDPDDRKSVYEVGLGEMTVEQLAAAMTAVLGEVSTATRGKLYILPVHGGKLETLEVLAKQPWVTIQRLGDAQA